MENIKVITQEFCRCNILKVAVGSNCPQGGDSGHGGRTYFSLHNLGGTDLRVIVDGKKFDADLVEIIFGGDSEHDTFIQALEFALNVLKREDRWVE